MKYEIIDDNQKITSEYIQELNNLYTTNPNMQIVLGLSSTKGLSSNLLKQLPPNIFIRVSGGYDDERVFRNKNKKYKNIKMDNFYIENVIYNRQELIEIVKEFEQLEADIQSNWPPLRKIIYIYDKLKQEIMYTYEKKDISYSENNSLRGIITKQTICTGFALIFKELMDRNGIDCEYVEGYTTIDHDDDHAWNIINLDGKQYPIDIVKDNAWFRQGKIDALTSFTDDVSTFANSHFPYNGEKTQNYIETLSQFNQNDVNEIIAEINKQREYSTNTYHGTRKDGSSFNITEIGYVIIDDRPCFRYYFEEIRPNGQRQLPLIVYSEDNITGLIYDKIYNRKIPKDYEESINNALFSLENIQDSAIKSTFYLGNIATTNQLGKTKYVTSPKEIIKPDKISKKFSLPTKMFQRKDGTTFVIQQTPNKTTIINGITIYEYDIVETITKNNKSIVKKNTIYTEKELFSNNIETIISEYLSRKRIDTISEELGGYIGTYEDGIVKYNQELLKHFKKADNINQNISNTRKK